MTKLAQFVRLSKYAGERYDLVQAGGGNTSVKLDEATMLIKASGFLLSDVEKDRGYVKVDNKMILDFLSCEDLEHATSKQEREKLASEIILDSTPEIGSRPSIETFLHSLLGRYVLHTHPLAVNAITCRKDWKTILSRLFDDCIFVDYRTPGIDLGLELKQALGEYGSRRMGSSSIIFLKNHGLIVSGQNVEQVIEVTEKILTTIEKSLNADLSRYKLTTKISTLVNSLDDDNYIAYLSDDMIVNDTVKANRSICFTMPFCPDKMVFCGVQSLELLDLDSTKPIQWYRRCYQEMPKVIIFEDNVFFIAKNLKKAKDVEDVFKFHLTVLNHTELEVIYLPEEELAYLGNWEAEKYRQNINSSGV